MMFHNLAKKRLSSPVERTSISRLANKEDLRGCVMIKGFMALYRVLSATAKKEQHILKGEILVASHIWESSFYSTPPCHLPTLKW